MVVSASLFRVKRKIKSSAMRSVFAFSFQLLAFSSAKRSFVLFVVSLSFAFSFRLSAFSSAKRLIMHYALQKAPRSGMNNRRVAGAVVLPAFRIHYVQTKNSTGDCRPGGEAFWCVLCISWFSNNQCNPCILWFLKFSCSFVLFVVSIMWKACVVSSVHSPRYSDTIAPARGPASDSARPPDPCRTSPTSQFKHSQKLMIELAIIRP